jgi:UDP-3-O-[3-hydroxymyristoyl] glucosamine N-acyltransferase LpxD
LRFIKDDIWLIAPKKLEDEIRKYQEQYCPTVNAHFTDYPEFEFTIYHNRINKNKPKTKPVIGNKCQIHESSVIGVDGMKAVNCPNGDKVHFLHTGHVMVGDNVTVGPYTVIHRGTMGITTIGNGCQIGSRNNIGHNCSIGLNNVLASGVIFNGGICTGANCWFGSGSVVRHYTTITDDVVVGQLSNVLKDINKSGIYAGNPVRFLKEYEKGWNF